MFEYKYRIKFHDVDAAGIIFYANIFKIAHDAFQEMLWSFELSVKYFSDKEYAFPIVHSEADYFSPLKFNQEIIVKISVIDVNENSFKIIYLFTNENKIRFAEVKTVHVCVDKTKFDKTKLPEYLKLKLT